MFDSEAMAFHRDGDLEAASPLLTPYMTLVGSDAKPPKIGVTGFGHMGMANRHLAKDTILRILQNIVRL